MMTFKMKFQEYSGNDEIKFKLKTLKWKFLRIKTKCSSVMRDKSSRVKLKNSNLWQSVINEKKVEMTTFKLNLKISRVKSKCKSKNFFPTTKIGPNPLPSYKLMTEKRLNLRSKGADSRCVFFF